MNINFFSPNRHIIVTKAGLDDLKHKLDELRDERLMICSKFKDLDHKDKVEYILANDSIKILAINESNILSIEKILNRCTVVDKKDDNKDVNLGSTVNLQCGDKIMQYTLVETVEANPLKNKISKDSPLGRLLMGKRMYESFSLVTPKGLENNYKIIAIV
ncbi:MAG: GreA/GreB family elongation factor [Candidatus Saccharibacteria bacterium]